MVMLWNSVGEVLGRPSGSWPSPEMSIAMLRVSFGWIWLLVGECGLDWIGFRSGYRSGSR